MNGSSTGRDDRGLTRRSILRSGVVASLLAASTMGCDALSTEPEQPGQPGRESAAKGREAPDLARQADAGEIPAVEERLPDDPLVVEPVDRIGTYGGTWRRLIPGPADNFPLYMVMGYENLVRWRPDTTEFSLTDVLPNVAAEFEVNPEGTEYTFRLRPGLKWSDGEPFSADDIVFWYEDVLMNPDITPALPAWLGKGEQPVTVEKLDDYEVRFVFAQPNGLFLHNLCTPSGTPVTDTPAHYLKRFHQKYAPDTEQRAKDQGLERWADLYAQKASWSENPDKPVLFGWQLTSGLGEATERAVAERNPFYWKVDPDGSQLPYIDRIAFSTVQDPEVMVLNALQGEVDMQAWGISRLQDKPLYHESRQDGDYDLFDTISASMNTMMIGLNMTHKNEALREIFSNRDFRIGLSYAINRPEIIKTVYQQQGEPWQGAPRPESPFHNEQLAKQYTEYDVEKANEHLDRAGYSERDGAGFRLGPDGKRISFTVEVMIEGGGTATFQDSLELIRGYWKEVGVDMSLSVSDRTLWSARKDANDHDAAVWVGDGGLDLIVLPRWYAPIDTWGSLYGLPWATWYASDGEEGEEPPPAARQQMELYDQVQATADPDRQTELMTELLSIAQVEFWAIGISLDPPGYGIVKNNFHNVPDVIQAGYMYPHAAPTNPCQYFIDAASS